MKTSAVALILLSAAVPAFSSSNPDGSGSDSETYERYQAVQGDPCDVDVLTQARYNVIEACCEGDDPELCPEYKQCQVAHVADNRDVKCLCVAAPEVGDKCDADLHFQKSKECDADCKECRVSKVLESSPLSVECGCVDVGEKECDEYAYDSCNYCRDEDPKQCANPAEGFEVSVCGDATYKVQTDDVANICSGYGEAPTGNLCPTKGDLASDRCRADIWSIDFGPEGKCQAPEDAQCMKLSKTGAWGCVFPTNCNEKRGCLAKHICGEKYEKVEGNKDACEETENGYLIHKDPTSPDYVDTANASEASATVSFKESEEGMATMTNVLSLIAGAFATSLAIFSSL